MLKLARNALADLQIFSTKTGEVKWDFIVQLYNYQNNLNLKFNKLSSVHVNWRNNKVKVKYAAQTLNSSVANAFIFLKNDNIKEFRYCEATVKFVKCIDRLFDFFEQPKSIQ